ncbi:MAG TPA: PAS domain-containing protein [Burkholderiales bacterium]|nr:PAS domain-containing protein [Burkholderiales bacterium]
MTVELEDLKSMWLSLKAHVDQLAGERQQYLDVFEQSQEAYVVTDAQGTIVDANGAAVDALQRRRRSLSGKPIAAMVALDRRAEFRSRLRRVAEGEAGAARSWNTVFESPGLRTDVTVTLRPIERQGTLKGLCWLLQARP